MADLFYNTVMSPLPVLSPIPRFIVDAVGRGESDLARLVSQRFGITRQAANHQIRRLTALGILRAEGRTRRRSYELAVLRSWTKRFPTSPDLAEDQIWRTGVAPLLEDLPESVRNICNYGVTEMVNNARDHSGSPAVTVSVECTAAWITVLVGDEGIGIFRKIREAAGLEDERHAIFELTKGKFTTDPERHTGEGIFFTSRMFDEFALLSGRLALVHDRLSEDWLIQDREPVVGTHVSMRIRPWATHTDREVFDHYATARDDYGFRRTHVVVALAQAEGERLVSRSQAKRIMARLERFAEVVLDFKGVTFIGPAFADEMFRVFRKEHPATKLVTIHTSEDVLRMIRRAESETPGDRSLG